VWEAEGPCERPAALRTDAVDVGERFRSGVDHAGDGAEAVEEAPCVQWADAGDGGEHRLASTFGRRLRTLCVRGSVPEEAASIELLGDQEQPGRRIDGIGRTKYDDAESRGRDTRAANGSRTNGSGVECRSFDQEERRSRRPTEPPELCPESPFEDCRVQVSNALSLDDRTARQGVVADGETAHPNRGAELLQMARHAALALEDVCVDPRPVHPFDDAARCRPGLVAMRSMAT
jgi:hypothetical protein